MKAKKILITGASSGFGKLTVPMLLERGHTVIAGIRGGQSRLKEVFEPQVLAHAGGKLIGMDLHVERPESIEAARGFIEQEFDGSLDVLINNAGYGLFGALEDLSREELRYQYEVNLFGVLFLTQALIPALKRTRGRILVISSIAGRFSFPFYGHYAGTKFALEAAFEGLHYDLKPFGVSVGLVEPGGFRTDFTSRSLKFGEKSMNPNSPYHQKTQAMVRSFKKNTPRLANPIRVAHLITRLCEKDSIRLRSPIGWDARFILILGWLLPDQWRIKLLDWSFRFAVFRN